MKGDVCRRHNCSKCCIGTEMVLTSADIMRIESSGKRDFYMKGSHRLRNIDGRCIFLDMNGKCTIYDIRPGGCRLYPLVMSLPSREPLLDEDCPHRDEFRVDPEDVIDLNTLIDTLIGEEK